MTSIESYLKQNFKFEDLISKIAVIMMILKIIMKMQKKMQFIFIIKLNFI